MDTFKLFIPCVNGDTKGILRIVKDWDESDVEWDKPWSEKGGDYSISKIATNTNDKLNVWEHYDVTEMVSYFVDYPSKNHGFILLFSEDFIEGTNDFGVYYASSEFDEESKRPKLTLNTGVGISNNFSTKKPSGNVIFYLTISTIHFTVINSNSLVTISNPQGQILTSLKANNKQKYEIPLNTLSTGVYFLNVKQTTKNETIPFMVTK